MIPGRAPSLTTSSTSLAPPTGPAPPESKAAPGTDGPRVSGTPSLPRPSTLQLAFTIYALFGVDRVCAGKPTLIDVVGDMLDAGAKNVVVGFSIVKAKLDRPVADCVVQGFVQNQDPSVRNRVNLFNVYPLDEKGGLSTYTFLNGSTTHLNSFDVDDRQSDTGNWQKLLSQRYKPCMATMRIPLALGRSPHPGKFAYTWAPPGVGMDLHKVLDGSPNRRLDVFATLQRTAPSMYVMSNNNWDTKNRQEASDFYESNGYAVGEFPVNDKINAMVLAPPLPGVIEKFEKYRQSGWASKMVRVPTEEAQSAFRVQHPRQFQPPAETKQSSPVKPTPPPEGWGIREVLIGLAGIVVTAAAAVKIGMPRVRPRLARGQPERDLKATDTRQTTRTGPKVRQALKPKAPRNTNPNPNPDSKEKETEKGTRKSPYDVKADRHIDTKEQVAPRPGEIYREHLQELRDTHPSTKRIDLIRSTWWPKVDRLMGGDIDSVVAAAAMMRAVIDTDPTSQNLGRMLDAFGISFPEITSRLRAEQLLTQNRDAQQQLRLLGETKRAVELAKPGTKDYNGDETGRQGSAAKSSLRLPAKPASGSVGDTKSPAGANFQHIDVVRRAVKQLVREGRAVEQGGDYFIPNPQAKPHLHLGWDFLSFKQENNHHQRVFANGAKLREGDLASAIDHMNGDPQGDICNLLMLIKGEGRFASGG